jgi:hypothetical protein
VTKRLELCQSIWHYGDKIIFSDKNMFVLLQQFNVQNDRLWSVLLCDIPAQKLAVPQFQNAFLHSRNRLEVKKKLLGFISKDEWPPSSPGLNPLDSSIEALHAGTTEELQIWNFKGLYTKNLGSYSLPLPRAKWLVRSV